MRGIIILVLLIVVLVFIGWIRFDRQPDRSSIHLETQEIQEDTRDAIDQGADLLRDTGDAIESDQSVPTESKPIKTQPQQPAPVESTEPATTQPVNPE